MSEDPSPEWRLKFLDGLDRLVNHENNTWLTEEVVAAIEPVCDAGMEMIREAPKLDNGKLGRPGMLDALAKFFLAFAVSQSIAADRSRNPFLTVRRQE